MTAPEAIKTITGLPGEELVAPGILDLSEARWTPESLLLLIARGRLICAGFTFLENAAPPSGEIETLLYNALDERDSSSAYQVYNSWKRRLDSFIRCLESRERRPSHKS